MADGEQSIDQGTAKRTQCFIITQVGYLSTVNKCKSNQMTLEPGCRSRKLPHLRVFSHLDTPIPTSFRYLPPLSYTHFPSLIFIHPDLANVSSHGPGALGHLVCVAVWPRWPRRLHEGQEPTQCEYLVGRCTPSCMLHEGRPVPSPLPCMSLQLTAWWGHP